ncbi:hypothetical protein [Stieleria marina]|uniref:hypothetical protein n=1 Tax=Stieleria marina TaxID=1930275 RepID=UPI003AF3CEF6
MDRTRWTRAHLHCPSDASRITAHRCTIDPINAGIKTMETIVAAASMDLAQQMHSVQDE